MSSWYETLGVFDLETTGVDVQTSRIVSAHVGVIDAAGAVLEGTEWLANPGIEIPPQASAVHGITTEFARTNGRPPVEVVAEIVSAIRALFARGIPLVIYNAPYDLTLLNREAVRYGIPPLVSPMPVADPLVIDKAIDKYRKGKRTLEVACQFYGVSLLDAHDAGADAVAAGRLAQAIARAHPGELALEAQALHGAQVNWCREQAADFQAYMRRARDPAFTASGAWPER